MEKFNRPITQNAGFLFFPVFFVSLWCKNYLFNNQFIVSESHIVGQQL